MPRLVATNVSGIADLPPFPLLLLTSAGRQRDDVDAFAALSVAVAQEQTPRRPA